jgi:WD repeat-containing protein 70
MTESSTQDSSLGVPEEAALSSADASVSFSLAASENGSGGPATIIPLSPATSVHHNNYLLVGRQAASADIRIDHKSISRKHAVIYFLGEKLVIQDLKTKKGTKLNGELINDDKPRELNHGDHVQFGLSLPTFSIIQEQKQNGAKTQPEVAGKEQEQGQEDKFPELSGRAKRQAEIAAMMASLEETPSYQKYTPTAEEIEQQNKVKHVPGPSEASTAITSHDDATAKKYKLPLSDCFTIDNTSNISCLASEPSGARFITGSTDTNIRFFDFAGMNAMSPRPFSTITVQDGYPVRAISYSPNGDRLIVATGSVQPKVFDRNGEEIIKFCRGDVYVTNPTKTVGHTAEVTCVGWHPFERSLVVTGSRDGSIRWWDIEKGKLQFQMLTCSDVVCVKSSKGRKTVVTSLAYGPGGRYVAVGTECGSIQLWNPSQSKLRPQKAVYPSDDVAPISSIVISVDGTRIGTRTKNFCRVWSDKLSSSSRPVFECKDVSASPTDIEAETATIAFSPDSKYLVVSCSNHDTEEESKPSSCLKFFDTTSSKSKPKLVYPIPTETGFLPLVWNTKLNQIIVAGHSTIMVMYDPRFSKKGAMLTTGTRRTKKAEDDLQQIYQSRAPTSEVIRGEIITPNALPLFQPEGYKPPGKKRRRDEESERKNLPEAPAKGMKDLVGAQSSFTQFVVESTQGKQKAIAGKDPREALFQYKEGKSFISAAYEGNRERILADKTVEEDEDEMKGKKRKD